MQKLSFSPSISFALTRLQTAGYQAFLVGGATRDLLRGVAPKDYDVATSATVDQIAAVFQDCKLLETGREFGTMTLCKDGDDIEITAYRKDGEYADHRHPAKILYTNQITEDLARRDFTMNAVAYNEVDGWVDPFGGREDIDNKCIRAVGNPCKRFAEDALRILRLFRFGAQLPFSIDREALQAAYQNAPLLAHVSMERCYGELTRWLLGENAAEMVKLAQPVLEVFLPAIASGANLGTLKRAPAILTVRLCAALQDKTPPQAEKALKTVKAPNRVTREVATLLAHKDATLYQEKSAFCRLTGKLGVPVTERLLAFWCAQGVDTAQNHAWLVQIQEGALCCSRKGLAVTGADLRQIGLPQTQEIGLLLDQLLEQVLDSSLPNQKQALLRWAKVHYSSKNTSAKIKSWSAPSSTKK